MTETPAPGPRIVVGVDGSTGSRAALRWAAAHAALVDGLLVVVHAYLPQVNYLAGYAPLPALDPGTEQRLQVEDLAALLTDELGEDPGVAVHAEVTPGPAARLLLAEAAEADLLVVGARGHTGLAGLLLGSTAQSVARSSPCPVVVVPAEPAHRAVPASAPADRETVLR